MEDDKYRNIESARRYYKPKVIDRGFAGEVNNYMKYIREGNKSEKLSPREYLNMIRQDLRDLINKHKPIERLNNINNNNDDNNNNDNDNDDDNDNNTERGEWKIMLRMYIKCISAKLFNETRAIHPKSKQVEVYMGSDTENVIDTLFNTLLQNFQRI